MIGKLLSGLTSRFTVRARRAVVASLEEAAWLGHDSVGDEDLLLGVLVSNGEIAGIAGEMGFGVEDVRKELRRMFASSLASVGIDYGEVRDQAGENFRIGNSDRRRIHFSPLAKKALEEALKVVRDLRCNEIRAEHVLLGVLRLENGRAVRAIENLGVEIPELQRRLEVLRAV